MTFSERGDKVAKYPPKIVTQIVGKKWLQEWGCGDVFWRCKGGSEDPQALKTRGELHLMIVNCPMRSQLRGNGHFWASHPSQVTQKGGGRVWQGVVVSWVDWKRLENQVLCVAKMTRNVKRLADPFARPTEFNRQGAKTLAKRRGTRS